MSVLTTLCQFWVEQRYPKLQVLIAVIEEDCTEEMNRFRTKKKAAKEANEAAGRASRASNDSESPPIPNLKSSMTFKRGKKNVPAAEPKIELDLSTALPSSDDFRTSLLMSGLSARFSMLREQDDPKSKIGKASDDSVLFPKRQSRLDNNFTTFIPNGLSDIAEVASIRGSNQFFRPPFARDGKTESFHSTDGYGYGADDDSTHGGSIMGRSKPGEGNNLFGGRQKVYHIPLKAAIEGGSKGAGMGGRARYDDDISQSAFQRFKDRERQQREYDEEQARLAEDAVSAARSSSPLSGYNRNRETSSTTSSSGPGNTRTSTAATSIHSQGTSAYVSNGSTAPSTNGSMSASGSERNAATLPGLERAVTKTRRLYETGLEKNLHEQQHSAMSRIDSLTRQQNLRSQTPPLTLRSPTSVSNLSDRFERHELSTKQSQASLRAVSPPPSASVLGTFEFGARTTNPSPQSPFGEPPLSPPMSEGDDALSSNLPIDAKDKGKATALGAFNKPAQPYDDMKYSERQMQMKAGREIPQKSRPFQPPPPTNVGRNRAESNATTSSSRSRSSSAQRQPFVPRQRGPEMRSAEPRVLLSSPPSPATFHGGSDRSMNSAINNQRLYKKPMDMQVAKESSATTDVSLERPPESQHPANRLALRADFARGDVEQDLPHPSILLSQVDSRKGSVDASVDSPTLGPLSGLSGLSGMVRQHMRSDSNASSYFGAPSPGLTSRDAQDLGNFWGVEDWKRDQVGEQHSPGRRVKAVNQFSALPPPLSIKSPRAEPAYSDEESTRPSPLSARSPNIETSRIEEVEKPTYEKEVSAHHIREGSTQTQKESENFANELAERRKRVQENLKSFAESDSRSNSPVPDFDWTKEVSRMKSNPLGILKAKSSRESMVGNVQSKSRRMLGLGGATISSSPSPNKQAFDDDLWQREEEEMLQGLPKGPNISTHIKDFRRARREERQVSEKKWAKESESERSEPEAQHAPRQRKFSEENQPRLTQQIRHELPEASERVVRKASQESKGSASSSGRSRPSSRGARDRSNSAASGRSKSRNGMYRDDLAKAMAQGLSSSTQAHYEETPASRLPVTTPTTPYQPTMIPSPVNGLSTKSRSDSRPTPPTQPENYFNLNKNNLHPLQIGDSVLIGPSPRPSPVTPFSVNSTPSLTPNGSGTNTPITQVPSFQTQGRVPARKKTVNKSDISEPTLLSKTSQFETFNLPPGASLKNGVNHAPPLPPINPRRRQTRIQTMVGVFSGNKSSDSVPTMPSYMPQQSPIEDHSTFSADESDVKKPRKLRKSSSEGGNLHSRARQIASADPSPAMPSSGQGGMF